MDDPETKYDDRMAGGSESQEDIEEIFQFYRYYSNIDSFYLLKGTGLSRQIPLIFGSIHLDDTL